VQLQALKADQRRAEISRLESLKKKVEEVLAASPKLAAMKSQIRLDMTRDGLRIQIVDEQNRPMFALAKTDLQPYTREILRVIGVVLNEVPNRIGLSGHTDSTPYLSDVGYSNWELSTERANASRRELILGGMNENKILRVVGLASAANLDRQDPFNPINRRISIIVMNKKTEEAVMRDNATLQVPEQAAAAPAP
jgi:chemotaxis protein MotB